jgi:hypothetical protein
MKTILIAGAIGLAVLWNGAICFSAAADNGKVTAPGGSDKTASRKMNDGGREAGETGNQSDASVYTTAHLPGQGLNTAQNSNSGGTVEQKRVVFGRGGKIGNKSTVENSTGTAAGSGNTIHLGTIMIADVKIDGKVSNEAKITNSENIAIGEDSTANMGSVVITGGTIGKAGIVSNKTTIDNSRNMAMGKSNTANMGAVSMNNSKVDGKVENTSQVDSSSNITVGENNTANMGSTQLRGSHIGRGGSLLNTAETKKTANIVIGAGNKTDAGAVQVE